MQRDLSQFTGRAFDVVVVGGGIHGACVARDAALRGMSVALVEQGDFCGATSHNSLKTIHGGIRYLQHLNVRRAADSIREQQILAATMGHLVQPLRFMMPNYGWAMRGPAAMAAGIALFEALTCAVSLRSGSRIGLPQGRVISASHCKRLAPGVDASGLTGAGIWADAQVSHADKAVLQILRDAVECGAVVANYLRADRVLMTDGTVTGIGVTGEDGPFEIAASQVVNATGPWAARWLAEAAPHVPPQTVGLVRSMNLVIDRPGPDVAIAVKSRLESDSRIDRAKRMYFMVPWLGKTVIGTTHHTHVGAIDAVPDPAEIASFVAAFNAAYPVLDIRTEDVLYCYVGLTPGDDSVDADGAKLHESKVIDHPAAKGLVSIISIKWTTARLVAERVVDVLATRHATAGPCQTRTRTVPDCNTMPQDVADLDQRGVQQFVQTHIARSQARHLTDIMLRRTNDLILGRMTPEHFAWIVGAMTAQLGWSDTTRDQEVRAVLTRLMPQPDRQDITAKLQGVDL